MLSLGVFSHGQTRGLTLLHVALNDEPQPFTVDEPIWLHPAGTLPDGLHVRVFFASKRELETNRPGSDGCVPLTGLRMRLELAPGTIKVVPVSTAGTIRSTVVTLVFELGDSPITNTIRMANRTQMVKYIESGIEVPLKLAPEPANEPPPNVSASMAGAGAAGPSRNGHRFRRVSYAPGSTQVNPVVLEPNPSTRDGLNGYCYDVESMLQARAPDVKPDSAATVVALMEPFGCGQKPTLDHYNPTPAGF
jgi:hypothetical protein